MTSSSANETLIVLIPGMAADASVFAAQAAVIPGVVVVDWIKPLPSESLASYAQRFAEQIEAPAGCLLGGASFGGIVALEMARYVNPCAVVLIGSVPSPNELPLCIKLLRGAAPLTHWMPIRLCQRLVALSSTGWLERRSKHLAAISQQFSDADPQLLRWSLNAILRWRDAPKLECSVLRIHGDRDPIFPRPTNAGSSAAIISGGGHVISMSHAQEVNEFLRACLASYSHSHL